jgi:hypothetical protein
MSVSNTHVIGVGYTGSAAIIRATNGGAFSTPQTVRIIPYTNFQVVDHIGSSTRLLSVDSDGVYAPVGNPATIGSYGASNKTLIETIDLQGRVIGISQVDIAINSSQVNNLIADLSGTFMYASGSQVKSITGINTSQASQISAISGMNISQALQINSISGMNISQALQINSISGMNISQASQISAISAALGTGGVSLTQVAEASANAQIQTTNNLSALIFASSGMNISQASQISALSAGNVERISKTINQNSHGLLSGKCVRFNGTNWVYAQADSDINAESVGIIETYTPDSFILVFHGHISLPGESFTPSLVYFLDPYNAGALTSIEPSGDGKISKPMLFATSASTGIVYNMRGDLLSSASVVDTAHVQTISGHKTFEEFVSFNGGVNFKTQVISNTPYYVSDTDSVILVDTELSSINVILPLNPTNGRTVRIIKIHDNNIMSIDRNTRNIGGQAENISVSLNNYAIDLSYSSSKSSWYRG